MSSYGLAAISNEITNIDNHHGELMAGAHRAFTATRTTRKAMSSQHQDSTYHVPGSWPSETPRLTSEEAEELLLATKAAAHPIDRQQFSTAQLEQIKQRKRRYDVQMASAGKNPSSNNRQHRQRQPPMQKASKPAKKSSSCKAPPSPS
ncbi:MAG: hypothetical protein M1827_007615 [Pycnora praestabilis]|nr:MAG: hypothetical protein M1827_007615 [Pycnora praestabilis]